MEILKIVNALYSNILAPEGWSAALEDMARAVGGIGTVIVPLSAGETLGTIWSPELHEPVLAYQSGEWWRRDIRIMRGEELRLTSGVLEDTEFVPRDSMGRDPFYQDFLRPWGLGRALCQITSVPGGPVVSITVQAGVRKDGFDARERALLREIGAHAGRALSAGVALAQARIDAQVQSLAREHLAHGFVLLDAKGRVLHADAMAAGLFPSALSIVAGRLTAADRARRRDFDRLVESALPGGSPMPPLAIARAGQAPDLLVQAVPVMWEANGFAALAGGARAILLIHDLDAKASSKVCEHLVALGLTPGQARIADVLASGVGTREAGERLGLSEATVKSVAKAIYDRLDLSKQAQLASLVTKLRSAY